MNVICCLINFLSFLFQRLGNLGGENLREFLVKLQLVKVYGRWLLFGLEGFGGFGIKDLFDEVIFKQRFEGYGVSQKRRSEEDKRGEFWQGEIVYKMFDVRSAFYVSWVRGGCGRQFYEGEEEWFKTKSERKIGLGRDLWVILWVMNFILREWQVIKVV